MPIQLIKGFKDILPEEMPKWDFVEQQLKSLFRVYHFKEIRLPILEETALFSRSIGTGTDIVEKEMYTFEDRDGKKITLRPEGTASVVRAFIEHHLQGALPVTKLFYIGPMFRHERPQKGRFRRFYQAGAETIGVSGPRQDVEMLLLLADFFKRLKVEGIWLEINSVGCQICRPPYKALLQEFLKSKESELCENCKRRTLTNPMRVLDCKNESCQKALKGAPELIQHLGPECSDHFISVQEGLKRHHIPHRINPRLVRGLDYYTKTAFEWKSEDAGAQNTVAAGGRYDGLVEELGGPSLSGIGFAIGLERAIALMDPSLVPDFPLDLFVAALGQKGEEAAFPVLARVRALGHSAEMDYQSSGLKSQMKKADRYRARFVLILGEDELAKGIGIVRNMATKSQDEIPLDQAAEILSRLISK